MTERPNPDVDVTFPDGIDLHRFNFLIAGLGVFATKAAQFGDSSKANAAADLQLALLVENPEAAILADEVFGDVVTATGGGVDGIMSVLEKYGSLEGVDVEAVRDRVRAGPDGSESESDMTDIDIE